MDRLTVRLDDDLSKWVEEEAERRDRSKAYVVSEAIEAHRSESHQSGAKRTDEHTTASSRTDVERLESRLTEVEQQLEKLTDTPVEDTRSSDETPTPDTSKTPLHQPADVVDWVNVNAPVSRADIIEECYDGDAVDVSSDTWWRKRVRPALKEAGLEFVRNRGWE